MTAHRDQPLLPRRRPGPKPRGRTVIPLTITVTPAQRAALEVMAETQKSSISVVVRRLMVAGITAGSVMSALVKIGILRHPGLREDVASVPPL